MRRFYSLKLKAGGDAFPAGQIIGQNPDLMPRLGEQMAGVGPEATWTFGRNGVISSPSRRMVEGSSPLVSASFAVLM
jgi:hypothetical protein